MSYPPKACAGYRRRCICRLHRQSLNEDATIIFDEWDVSAPIPGAQARFRSGNSLLADDAEARVGMTHAADPTKHLPFTSGLAALIYPWLLPIVAGVVLGMTLVSFLVQPVWGDQSWLLYAAGRVLDGARLGTDIVETNPPTIIWLSEIPMALSRMIGMLPETMMKICLGSLIVFSAGWCASMIRRAPHPGSRSMALWLAIGIIYATTVYSWSDIGQREHIMALLLLPYLVAAATRLDGVSLGAWEGFAAGAAALVALSLKPHHVLIIAGVEALLAWRIGFLRSVVRPEAVGAVVAGLIYAAAVAIFAPDYVTKVVPLDYEAYLGYQKVPLLALIEPGRTIKIVTLLLLYAVVRRRLQHRALCDVLAIAGIGATIGYLIQQKGWQSQFLPADAYLILLFGSILTDRLIGWAASLHSRRLGAPVAVAISLMSGLLIGPFFYSMRTAKADTYDYRVAVQKSILDVLPAGTPITVLGVNYSTIFDFVLRDHLQWGSRSIGFWTLEAIFDAETAADGNSKRERLAELVDAVQWTRDAADEDLRRWKPSIILVERCADRTISCGTSESLRKVDMLQWFQQDPAFKADWGRYERCRQIGYYDVWYLTQDENLCKAIASIATKRLQAFAPSR